VLKELMAHGFCKFRLNSKKHCGEHYLYAKSAGYLIHKDHINIIRHYNAFLYRCLDYYSFATNYRSFNTVKNLLKVSCARTLAQKFRLSSAASAFKKFGTHLAIENIDLKSKKSIIYGLFLPKSMKSVECFKIKPLRKKLK
jgi:hypothetical protein